MLVRDAVHGGPQDTDIHHMVLTRFNMRVFRHSGLEDRDRHRDWMQQRLVHFERVCLPSLLAQKRRPDQWVIAFDGLYRPAADPVLDLVADHDWILPVWQAADEPWEDTFRRAVASESVGKSLVATTRCDNDDAISVDYLQNADRYSRSVIGSRRGALDFWLAFPNGAQLVAGRFFHYIHATPHFLTRVIRGPRAIQEHVFDINHSHLFADAERETYAPLTREPAWAQNVHESNVMNTASSLLGLGPAARVAAGFGIRP